MATWPGGSFRGRGGHGNPERQWERQLQAGMGMAMATGPPRMVDGPASPAGAGIVTSVRGKPFPSTNVPAMTAPVFADKIGLVIGVANKRSISWAIAKAASAAGARLVLTYQNERLEENVRELAATLPDPMLAAVRRHRRRADGCPVRGDRRAVWPTRLSRARRGLCGSRGTESAVCRDVA